MRLYRLKRLDIDDTDYYRYWEIYAYERMKALKRGKALKKYYCAKKDLEDVVKRIKKEMSEE